MFRATGLAVLTMAGTTRVLPLIGKSGIENL
jgi:hypothetical protein